MRPPLYFMGAMIALLAISTAAHPALPLGPRAVATGIMGFLLGVVACDIAHVRHAARPMEVARRVYQRELDARTAEKMALGFDEDTAVKHAKIDMTFDAQEAMKVMKDMH